MTLPIVSEAAEDLDLYRIAWTILGAIFPGGEFHEVFRLLGGRLYLILAVALDLPARLWDFPGPGANNIGNPPPSSSTKLFTSSMTA